MNRGWSCSDTRSLLFEFRCDSLSLSPLNVFWDEFSKTMPTLFELMRPRKSRHSPFASYEILFGPDQETWHSSNSMYCLTGRSMHDHAKSFDAVHLLITKVRLTTDPLHATSPRRPLVSKQQQFNRSACGDTMLQLSEMKKIKNEISLNITLLLSSR
jgi:hypothetical protein